MAANRNLRADVRSHPSGVGVVSNPLLIDSSKGARVALHDLGGDGPPVLLTHANGFCGRMWQPVADVLGSVARCWALDFRGHGDSLVAPDEDFAWGGMADDVLAAVDALDPAPRLVAGHSLGGAALMLAELARPGTFDRAWLFEPVIIPPRTMPRDGVNQMSAVARSRQQVFESRDAAYERYASRPPLSVFTPEALRAYVDHGFRDLSDGTVALKCSGETEATIFESSEHDGFVRLGEVAASVTVAVGADAEPPAMVAPLVAEQLPHATLVGFGDLSHFGPMQDPPRIAASIAAALFVG